MIGMWENEGRAARCNGRPWTHSLDYAEEGLAMKATRSCSIADCNQPHHALDLCRRHHNKQSYAKRAVPGGRKYPPRARCEVDARGFCEMHWKRWRLNGDPTVSRRSWRWLGDQVGYVGMHDRLRNASGPASDHPCADCGQPAADWSYDHRDADQKVEVRANGSLVYSTKIDHYQPRCVSCHKLLDNAAARA